MIFPNYTDCGGKSAVRPRHFCFVVDQPAPCMEIGKKAPRLANQTPEPCVLKALLAPLPSEGMTCWPVGARVGNVKNNDTSLIEPIKPALH
jgi:hypothetical protein